MKPSPRLSEVYQTVSDVLGKEIDSRPPPAIFLKIDVDDEGCWNEEQLRETLLGAFEGVSESFTQPFLLHGDSLLEKGETVAWSGWSPLNRQTEGDAASHSDYALGMIRRSPQIQKQLKASSRIALLPNLVKDAMVIRCLFIDSLFHCGSQLRAIGTVIPPDAEQLFSDAITSVVNKIKLPNEDHLHTCCVDIAFTFEVTSIADAEGNPDIVIKAKTAQLLSINELSSAGTLFPSVPAERCENINFKHKLTGPVIAIGDVHGELGDLKKLLAKIDTHIQLRLRTKTWDTQPHIVFVGDYVDRGRSVKKTIQFLIDLKNSRPPGKTHFIFGNHDFAFSAFTGLLPIPNGWDMRCQTESYSGFELWGGKPSEQLEASGLHLQGLRYASPKCDNYSAAETFDSYGTKKGDRKGLTAGLPASHKEFFKELHLVIEHDDYLFVHGGLQPRPHTWEKYSVEEQLLILRNCNLSEPFLEPLQYRSWKDIPSPVCKRLVVGHVRVPVVKVGEHIIRLDTTNMLSAISLPEEAIFQSADPYDGFLPRNSAIEVGGLCC